MKQSVLLLLLFGVLLASCQGGTGLTSSRSSLSVKPSVISITGRDLVLMADERQAVHYRMLAAERMSAASRLAEAGDEEATTHMLFGAIAYQGLAEEAAARVADRLARTYQED